MKTIIERGWLLTLTGVLLVTVVACGRSPAEPREDRVDLDLQGWYDWDYFFVADQREAFGIPTVVLNWRLPSQGWSEEPFEIFGRRDSTGQWRRIATVTSCGAGECMYVDANVSYGQSYEYYVVTRDGRGTIRSDRTVRVDTGPDSRPATPPAPTIYPFTWGNGGGVFIDMLTPPADGKNLVFQVERPGASGFLAEIGSTDGPGFIDERTETGGTHGYRYAVMDAWGHVSNLSETGRGPAAFEMLRMSVIGEDPAPAPGTVEHRGTDQHGREILLHRAD